MIRNVLQQLGIVDVTIVAFYLAEETVANWGDGRSRAQWDDNSGGISMRSFWCVTKVMRRLPIICKHATRCLRVDTTTESSKHFAK